MNCTYIYIIHFISLMQLQTSHSLNIQINTCTVYTPFGLWIHHKQANQLVDVHRGQSALIASSWTSWIRLFASRKLVRYDMLSIAWLVCHWWMFLKPCHSRASTTVHASKWWWPLTCILASWCLDGWMVILRKLGQGGQQLPCNNFMVVGLLLLILFIIYMMVHLVSVCLTILCSQMT